MAWELSADRLEANDNAISICEHAGDIWGGMAYGKLYRFDTNIWTKLAERYDANGALNGDVLASYNSTVHACCYLARLIAFDTDHWDLIAPRPASALSTRDAHIFNSKLYEIMEQGSPPASQYLMEYTDAGWWDPKANLSVGNLFVWCLEDHNSKLYIGASQGAKLYEWDGAATLTLKAQYGTTDILYALCDHASGLYGAGLNGVLYLYDEVSAWGVVAPQYGSEDIHCLISALDGNLYAGTYPNGYLLRFDVDHWGLVCSQYDASSLIINCLLEKDGYIWGGDGYGRLLRFPTTKLKINKSSAWKGATAKLDISATWKVTSLKVAKGGNMLIGDAHDLIGDVTDTIAEYGGRHWKVI